MSQITDTATIAIALAALGLSLQQMWSARRDRRISVRPKISFTREASAEKGSFRILMHNTGLGPAEIVQFSFSAGGRCLQLKRANDIAPLLKSIGVNGCHLDRVAHITPGDFFPVGRELRAIDLSEIELYPGRESLFDDCFEPLNIHVRYRSMYGEDFVASADIH